MPDTEFKLARAGDVALVTIDNGEDHTKPAFFGRAALASLDRVLDELERGDFAALGSTIRSATNRGLKSTSSPIGW